jgi:tripartite-type tricarboxylate transporter receptor subunit TctC
MPGLLMKFLSCRTVLVTVCMMISTVVYAQGTEADAAKSWPSKTVRIVVPAPAGSSIDIVARLLADKLADSWKQAVVVDNKPGAGGMIGVDAAAKATDGHTLALGFNGPLAFAPALYKRVPYDVAKDLQPVVMTTVQPNVLAVNAALPVSNVREFVAYAKANPGKLNYGSIGNGSSSHLAMELFKRSAGFEAQHIPFNGSPPAAASLAAGDTQALLAVASGILPQVKGGKIKLLAVMGKQRMAFLPELPSLAESGIATLNNFEALAWNGLVAPASMPREVVMKINRDVNAVINTTALKARLYAQGMQVAAGTPEAFNKVLKDDAQTWGALISQLGIKLD